VEYALAKCIFEEMTLLLRDLILNSYSLTFGEVGCRANFFLIRHKIKIKKSDCFVVFAFDLSSLCSFQNIAAFEQNRKWNRCHVN